MRSSETTITGEFDRQSWDMVTGMARLSQLVSGEVLTDLAEQREDICVLHSDSALPTRVDGFGDAHPDRFFNFGIAERNMLSAAAGLASVGFRPYVAGYASFLALMGVEQIRTDISYPGYAVRMLASNSGLATGSYGTTHHATEDMGVLSSIAGLTILAPVDGASLEHALRTTIDLDGPIYFRLGRGSEPSVYTEVPSEWALGSSVELRAGKDVTLLATGVCVGVCLQAAERLNVHGIDAGVVDMCSIKPIDGERISAAAANTGILVTVEDHKVIGGMGSQVAMHLTSHNLNARLVPIGVPDQFAPGKPREELYKLFGIDPLGVVTTVLDALGRA